MQDTSTIDIDLAAIEHNMSVIRRVVGDRCALCPIVKADAYGLGVSRVARRLVAAGAEMLAVYSLRQAIETAAAVNGATPILVLMPVTEIAREDELVRLMLGGQLHLVVHDEANLAALEACGAIMAPGDLRPVVRWSSQIVQAKEVPAGTAVGYGARWTAPRDSTIALVPVGYADGYPTQRGPSANGSLSVRLHAPRSMRP